MLSFLYNLLYSTVSIIVGLFFILLGIIGLLLPWSPHIRTDFIQLILENSIAISLFGFGFLIIGVIVVIEVFSNMRRKTYYVRKGRKMILIDEEIMSSYLQSYWKQSFPQRDIPSRLLIKKNRIKVIAELPFVPVLEQESLVEHIQEDLQDIFSRILGYTDDLVVAISFQTAGK